MNFAEIHNLYLDFKRRLTSIVGREVFPEITVNPPKGDSDELSFMRLVAWGYVLLFESGRGAFGFLKKLPPLSDTGGPLVPHLHALRTWASHNLVFDKKRDIRTVRIATVWLLSKCETGSPSTSDHWKVCFEAIATDLKDVLEGAIAACDCFDKRDDRDNLIAEFQKCLDRNWDAYVFDEYVDQAFQKFGYAGLSATEIRASHLEAWRKIVVVSDEEAIQRNLTMRIENDVLNIMASSLPLISKELDGLLDNPSEGVVTTAMLLLREKAGERLVNVHEVLAELRALG
ncbi:hypothetical protein [Pseudomonas ogarae]|uniref:hypothetical protein n=1 Tax=Pseudomonas ogarae (strain DSM 112162 / CECT 30235 / F113) TaxID=1114970 RepID=UPI00195167ED|nr:hypothetical protein [Pseudomonas ogarae]